MALELKADDLFPWGKYNGRTLREIYSENQRYYNRILNDTENFRISEHTQKLLESGDEKPEKSFVTFSRGARLNKKELKPNDILIGGPYEGYSLKEVYDENETYFRYLVQGNIYFISEATFEELSILKYGESAVHKKSREELDRFIDRKINGFNFDEDEVYTNKDLVPYIGEEISEVFSDETQVVIDADKRHDKYGLKELLKSVFGEKAKFRDGQEEAILAVLNGKKTLVVQRTGWGKSLVYFLSIKKLRNMGKGIAIIISPLLALMNNQIDSTKKYGLNVKAINATNEKEWNSIYTEMSLNKLDALIISPERLGNEEFMHRLEGYINRISLFVVDEAHCISDWGHDFRPDFRRIIKLVRKLPKETAVLATTATANDRVVRDIKYQLGSDLEILRGTMDRATLNIDVLNLGDDWSKKRWLINNIPKLNGVGIIYCLTIRDCEEVTELLQTRGINAEIYHSKIPPEKKIETENRFQNNEIKALVATIAFGMGVDKPDIAFVIHYQQPGNAISYYQQIGRAGRDIYTVPKAYTILLAGDNDNSINKYFIMNAFPTENEMNEVIEFITDNPGCSRNMICDALDVGNTWADKVIKYLLVNGDIYRINHRYFKTSKEWECDMKRARIVSWFRWRELRRFNQFVTTKQCYMKFLRDELDDTNTTICGRCSNCLGHHFTFKDDG